MTTKELLALVEKATPGPWKLCDGPEGFEHRVYMDGLNLTVAEVVRNPDASLIVAAVNALPALCAEVEALRKDAERLDWLEKNTLSFNLRYPPYMGWIRWKTLLHPSRAAIDAAKEPK